MTIHVRLITPVHRLWENEREEIETFGNPRVALEVFNVKGELVACCTFGASRGGWEWMLEGDEFSYDNAEMNSYNSAEAI